MGSEMCIRDRLNTAKMTSAGTLTLATNAVSDKAQATEEAEAVLVTTAIDADQHDHLDIGTEFSLVNAEVNVSTGDLAIDLTDAGGNTHTLTVEDFQTDALDTIRVDYGTGQDPEDGVLDVYTVAPETEAPSDDNTIVFGTTEADQVKGGGGDDLILGGGGDDIVIGGAGNDSIRGGQGDDTLQGGAGNDRLEGGPGIDVADFSDASWSARDTCACR